METNFKSETISARCKLCCRELQANKLVLLETDTILGISCLIKPSPISDLYKLKKRVQNKPFLVAAKHIEYLLPHINLNSLSEEEIGFINKAPDCPTSFIVPTNKESYLYRFGEDIGFRLIRTGILAEVTEYLQQGVITTSCNIHNEKPVNDPILAVQKVSRDLVLAGPYKGVNQDSQPSKIYHVKKKTWLR